MSTFTTGDGTQIYYKDWCEGPTVMFSHGWSLSADAWEISVKRNMPIYSPLST